MTETSNLDKLLIENIAQAIMTTLILSGRDIRLPIVQSVVASVVELDDLDPDMVADGICDSIHEGWARAREIAAIDDVILGRGDGY